jgi:hypothetical protein
MYVNGGYVPEITVTDENRCWLYEENGGGK